MHACFCAWFQLVIKSLPRGCQGEMSRGILVPPSRGQGCCLGRDALAGPLPAFPNHRAAAAAAGSALNPPALIQPCRCPWIPSPAQCPQRRPRCHGEPLIWELLPRGPAAAAVPPPTPWRRDAPGSCAGFDLQRRDLDVNLVKFHFMQRHATPLSRQGSGCSCSRGGTCSEDFRAGRASPARRRDPIRKPNGSHAERTRFRAEWPLAGSLRPSGSFWWGGSARLFAAGTCPLPVCNPQPGQGPGSPRSCPHPWHPGNLIPRVRGAERVSQEGPGSGASAASENFDSSLKVVNERGMWPGKDKQENGDVSPVWRRLAFLPPPLLGIAGRDYTNESRKLQSGLCQK